MTALRATIIVLVLAAPASAQTPAGGEFQVNTYTTDFQLRQRAAMAPNGDFVVVWTSFEQDGSSTGVFGQRFEASGGRRGAEFRVNSITAGQQGGPSVAMGRGGDFVVVWGDGGPNQQDIRGRRYDAAGNTIGAEFLVNTFTPGYQYWPQVARAADGRFVVAWTSVDNDGDAGGIAGRRFDASGNPIGGEFVVNAYTTGDQAYNDVAMDANGNFVAVWLDRGNRDGSGWAVFGQRYDASGNRLGSEFLVNTYTTGDQRLPSVSMSPAGDFVVAWSGPGDGSPNGVFARMFDAAGNAVGNDFVVNTSTAGDQYGDRGKVDHDALGNFIISWQGPVGVARRPFAQRFSASGAHRGAEFQTNTFFNGAQFRPTVVSDPVGNFVVAWDGDFQDGSALGVFAQRYGGLAPAALDVDSLGNRVLEPGDTVEVRPTWRNFNGAAQTFGGTLTSITGPAGATYAITDGAGDYGTVADGVSAQCADCYAVSVSNPPARPALHWDASAVESILPDTQGQQKQWLLHIGESFIDVPSISPYYRFIETLLHHNITGGCSATEYCPSATTTREQMAVFVLIAKERAGYAPPACGATPVFADVPASSPFCRWIEELSRRGVVSGCGGGNYCPTSSVTREQMAVFVLRTLDAALSPPACGAPMFADVPATSPFCRWIEELARRGVVTGCGGGNYCPTSAVTREQMGVFISVTFGLALYGP